MMAVSCFLGSALLCFDGRCYPALVGRATPTGRFALVRRFDERMLIQFGGDVLSFHESDDAIWAIHRTEPGRERFYALTPAERRLVTNGCINVQADVYDRLALKVAISGGAILHVTPARMRPGQVPPGARTQRLARVHASYRRGW
jgi:hypothetical protein